MGWNGIPLAPPPGFQAADRASRTAMQLSGRRKKEEGRKPSTLNFELETSNRIESTAARWGEVGRGRVVARARRERKKGKETFAPEISHAQSSLVYYFTRVPTYLRFTLSLPPVRCGGVAVWVGIIAEFSITQGRGMEQEPGLEYKSCTVLAAVSR